MSETNPSNWSEITLEEIVKELESGSRPKGGVKGITSGIPSIGGEHLNSNGGFNLTNIRYVPKEFYEKMSKASIYKDDILIVKDGATTGKVSFVDDSYPFEKSAVNEHVFILRVFNPIFSKFVFYFLFSQNGNKEILNNFQGSAQGGINRQFISNTFLPLAPLNEQIRIVAKLDAIMPRIEAVKVRLDKVPGILKRFRQSVLTAAVTGKLTEQWREEHPEVESADKAIEKLFKSRLQKCFTLVQKQKIEELYIESESEDESFIPDTWKYSFLSKICDSFQYGTSAKSDKEGKVIVLRMGNLQNGKIDWSDLAYTSDDNEIKKYLLKKDDVLFNRTNSPELVGKTSIYTGEKKAMFAGYLIRINNYRDVLDSHYLNFALNTGYAREFCHREKTDGVSQSNINAQKLAHFEIPLPPIEEQKEIVRQVDKLFALADKVDSHYRNAKARVDKLSQSVLAKAFRGELVPQDPNDEPAEMLLERILEEKSKMEAALKGTRKRETKNPLNTKGGSKK